jgi:hypothetical protein
VNNFGQTICVTAIAFLCGYLAGRYVDEQAMKPDIQVWATQPSQQRIYHRGMDREVKCSAPEFGNYVCIDTEDYEKLRVVK